MVITAITLVMGAAFIVGAIIGDLLDQRDRDKAGRDDAWADEFISVMHGSSPALFDTERAA